MENTHIELINKYLADNDSVSQEELETNANSAACVANYFWNAAADATDAWRAADSADAAYDWDAWEDAARAGKAAYLASSTAAYARKAADAAYAANVWRDATADWARDYEGITNGK